MHYTARALLVIMMAALLCFSGCHDDKKNSGISGPPDKTDGLALDPGQGNLAGRVVGTVYGRSLAGVTVSVNSRSVITESDGSFLLYGVGEGSLAVILSGEGIYPRTKVVNTARDGRSISVDAIETGSSFDLNFYRELARGNHPLERDIFPTHRWTNPQPPKFYINTNAAAAKDGTIDQWTIDATIRVLKEIVPIFTGNFYSAIDIEQRYFASDVSVAQIPDNAFVISFDDSLQLSGAYGLTYTIPDFISPTTSTIHKALVFVLDNDRYYKAANPSRIAFEEIVAHESGHGFGFRHSSEPKWGGKPSVMVKTGEFGGTYSLYDQLHMSIVYHRPAGNTDLDNDPLPGSNARALNAGPQVFLDQRAEQTLPAHERRALNRLQRFDIVEELLQQEGK
ncbi:hypothetical protein CSB45_12880 [candidate division KSB3 bacterium]|uniref:Peptidase M10 metallopeptidase domain-containing protein n=1 Tax=candidate division KSB3 bacterium TaxID=2044937 RepID=A0A2G6E1Y6_9BACT|nr:MAG: hypothetical protein CSB45_12880 [candidate division KSB3 bacterium]PIE28764.1 MAG: hypothetical protein CSA57_12070 [candidate division KSB3 bacterium]